jgi:hypothetical protein
VNGQHVISVSRDPPASTTLASLSPTTRVEITRYALVPAAVVTTMSSPTFSRDRNAAQVSRCPAIAQFPRPPGAAVPATWPRANAIEAPDASERTTRRIPTRGNVTLAMGVMSAHDHGRCAFPS